MARTGYLLIAFPLALAACNADAPFDTANHMAHQNGLMLSSLTAANEAQSLAALRQLTAPFHDVEAAEAAGYALLTLPPLTASDGCVSDATQGGMGYHYTRGNNLADDSVS